MTLTPLTRRILALAILVTLIALALELIVQPLLALPMDRWAEISTLTEQRDHLKAIVERRPELDERSRVAKAELARSASVWVGASGPAVAANIQNLVRQAAVGSGGKLQTASEGAEALEHGFRRVTVRFGIEGTLETVQQTLRAIEHARPSLFVETVTFSALASGFNRDRPPLLNVSLSVIGYMETSR